jgi:hypothetical protein
MEKIAIVINGVGGCGKDTLVSILGEKYRVQNTSSITPVVDVAKYCGWDGVKTDKSRKFLSDLKKILGDFNDFSLNYLLGEQEKFLSSDDEIMFVHIREPQEIERFMSVTKCKTYTILITPREELVGKVYGNSSDDDVANYDYDFVFHNDKPLEVIETEWIEFVEEKILKGM